MKILTTILTLLCWVAITSAQQTTFWPNCSGLDDTARFTTIITNVGVNTATIRLPYKAGTRCAVGNLTIPDNITLDNSDGTGIRVITGQTLTVVGPVVSPVGKPMFFGPGTTLFTGNTHIGANGQCLVSNGLGGTSFATCTGGGGGGAVNTVFGRSGDVVAVTNDYTWAQINKATSSLADITFRSADLLSNGVTGTGQVALRDTPTFITPILGDATASSINGMTLSGTGSSLAISAGKTFAVTNSLTLAADADGFTFTIPATGTAVLTSRTITEGAGLAGNTYDLSANRTLQLGTPSTLSVTSLTSVSGTTHSHAITSSANPGASQSLLATNTSGHLQLFRLGIATAPTQPLEVNGNVLISAATANLFLRDTLTGLQAVNSGVVTLQNSNALRSTNFTSDLVGWGINAIGDAEFANVNVRGAIRSAVFTFNSINATAGTLGVFKSAAKLISDVTIPSSPTYGTTTVTVDVEDADGLSHIASQLFVVNDILRLKDGVTGDTWLRVTSVSDQTTFWRYTSTIMAGSNNVTYRSGMAVADYGQSGDGFITLTADQSNAPYEQMATHTATFTSVDSNGTLVFTPRLRFGNLNGSYGYGTNTFGFATGTYGTVGQSWTTVDATNGVRIGNNTTPVIWLKADGSGYLANSLFSWDTAGNVTIAGNATIANWTINSNQLTNGTTHLAANFDIPAGQTAWFGKQTGGSQGWFLRDGGGRYITTLVGATAPSFPYMAMNDGTNYRVVIGGLDDTFNSGPSVNSMGMKIWDNSGVLLVQFSDLANTIAGWTITSSRISTGSGSTTVGMDASSTGGDDIRFFAGNSTPSSAPFRVTESGALTATNATITGAITATSGTFAGSLSAATGTFAGDLSGANMFLTGKLSLSGAGSVITIGTTPPASCTSGSGVFIDRTGICSVNADLQIARLDSSGLNIFNSSSFSTAALTLNWAGAASGFLMATGAGTARFTGQSSGTIGAAIIQANETTNNRDVNLRLETSSSDTKAFLFGDQFSGLTIGDATTAQAMLDVRSDKIRISTAKTPASATDTCTQGTIAWDANFVYVCIATNTWKRSAISTW